MVAPGLYVCGGQAIARRGFQPRPRETEKRLRINEFIRTSSVFLVDENNEKIGVVETDEARRRAREAGLDLVEVAPQSQPPVCRIMDYGKWKYQQRKKEQKARSHSKTSELKEVRLRPKIDEHDLKIKTDKSVEFLGEGHKVQFTMLFRGREMAHQDIGLRTMQSICEILAPWSKVESTPRMMGRRMTMLLAPERKPKAAGKSSEESGASESQPANEAVVSAPKPQAAP
ncbi:MAG: translation initiation factor IF-3 [Phycisphaeraceae bacterium]|nr:translation initiation factor IF-3 [Phycisphaeraceae bacterium]